MAIPAVTPDLIARLNDIMSTMGADVKSLNEASATLAAKQGDLSLLTTAEKSNLVGAINEVKALVDGIDLASLIDDTATSGTKTWSSSKIVTEIQAAVDGIIDGAPGALDTINELAAALQDNPDIISTITTALGKTVRVDVAQTFTDAEKAQGRSNIGAASEADLTQLAANVGDVSNLSLTTYTNARDGV